jgi:hypothetical protein
MLQMALEGRLKSQRASSYRCFRQKGEADIPTRASHFQASNANIPPIVLVEIFLCGSIPTERHAK